MPTQVAEFPELMRRASGSSAITDSMIESWADGKAWKFTQGVDYTCKPANFGSYIRRRFLKLGYKIETRVRGKHLFVMATGIRD